MHKVLAHVASGTSEGATLYAGGERLSGGFYDKGFFVAPTILDHVARQSAVFNHEIFGPVLTVTRFRSAAEAVSIANDTTYGLTAAVIAGSEAEAMPIAERLNAGAVFVQDTFLTFAKNRTIGTNSFGFSGVGGGSRTGPEAILRFLRRKALLTQHGEPADIQNDHHLPREN